MLLNLIKHARPDISKIYLYVGDPFESKYQLLINGGEKAGIKKSKNLKAFVDYSQRIDDAYENLEDYNPTKKRKVLTVVGDMIVDIDAKKKLSLIFTELFIRGRKLAIEFKVPKTIKLNTTHYFIIKIPNERKLQQIALNHFSDIWLKDFIKLHKDCTK